MSLLFDQNLPPRLVTALCDVFPGSQHVRDLGMSSAPDDGVWTMAIECKLAIVTKDSDFRQRSFLYGHPPKVVWIAVGNCSTRDIEAILRRSAPRIATFLADPLEAVLILRR